MHGQVKVAILAMLGMLLAGCAGGDVSDPSDTDEPGPSGPATFDDESGGIEGLVMDAEGQPVAGADVGILELEATTRSDSAGRFVFSNLAPGRHALFVQKLGYESASQNVEVLPGQSVQLQLVINQIVINVPTHDSFPLTGYFECTWRYSFVVGGASGPCGYTNVNDTTGNPLEDHVFTNSQRKWNYPAGPGVHTVLNEMTWTAGSAATGDNLRIFFSYADRSASHTYCQADGFSPLAMEWEREDGHKDGECLSGGSGGLGENPTIDYEEGEVLQTFVSVGVMSVNGVGTGQGFAYDQRFEMWISIFYWDMAPEAFSALPDA